MTPSSPRQPRVGKDVAADYDPASDRDPVAGRATPIPSRGGAASSHQTPDHALASASNRRLDSVQRSPVRLGWRVRLKAARPSNCCGRLRRAPQPSERASGAPTPGKGRKASCPAGSAPLALHQDPFTFPLPGEPLRRTGATPKADGDGPRSPPGGRLREPTYVRADRPARTDPRYRGHVADRTPLCPAMTREVRRRDLENLPMSWLAPVSVRASNLQRAARCRHSPADC